MVICQALEVNSLTLLAIGRAIEREISRRRNLFNLMVLLHEYHERKDARNNVTIHNITPIRSWSDLVLG